MTCGWPLFLVLAFTGLTSSKGLAQRAPTLEQWREDLRFLSQQLVRRHADVFHHVSPENFNRASSL